MIDRREYDRMMNLFQVKCSRYIELQIKFEQQVHISALCADAWLRPLVCQVQESDKAQAAFMEALSMSENKDAKSHPRHAVSCMLLVTCRAHYEKMTQLQNKLDASKKLCQKLLASDYYLRKLLNAQGTPIHSFLLFLCCIVLMGDGVM